MIAARCGNFKSVDDFYLALPEQLQRDEGIAKALLKAGCPTPVQILETVPRLLRSREAMMSAVQFPEDYYQVADPSEVDPNDDATFAP